jgi:hypothetical protein
MANFREAIKNMAREGAASLANISSEDSMTVRNCRIKEYIIETNCVILSQLVGQKNVTLPGEYQLAYPHDMIELMNPKKGDSVLLFTYGRFSRNGFALLSHNISNTAYELTRVGGEMFIGGII